MPDMIVLRFDLETPIQQTPVLLFTSNTSVNRRSDFLALLFITVKEVPGDIGLLSMNI